MSNIITIGADPELFLEKKGEIISAEGKIGGSKLNPKLISFEGHAIQEDNVMAEYNIPPSTTLNEFISNNEFVLNHLRDKFSEEGITLSKLASYELNRKHLKTAQAKEFGCEPDYNVYLHDNNVPPKKTGRLRCCGGHLHFGVPLEFVEVYDTIQMVKLLDRTIGVLSVLIDPDVKRRSMYGKAGSVRFKDYGFEYRSLSNFWIHNRAIMGIIYTISKIVIEAYITEAIRVEDLKGSDEFILKSINESDKKGLDVIFENNMRIIGEKFDKAKDIMSEMSEFKFSKEENETANTIFKKVFKFY